ncbi:MAG: Flp family type IVb pilin [Limnobacter sp.]|uniref:Flp family type IVb pilin n=1 Tax=Limnobacter sp. TaxID=2003368 RepID=UPI00391A431A
MSKIVKRNLQVKHKQDGASLIEYAVLAALIVVASVVAINALGVGIDGVFDRILNALDGTP